jgi:hypothetical protein
MLCCLVGMQDPHCLTWTFTPPNTTVAKSATCTKRTGAPVPIQSTIPGIVSGLSTKHMSRADALRHRQGISNQLRMSSPLSRDRNITLRIFVDGNIAEIFWQGGRVAQTIAVETYLTPVVADTAAAAVVSDGLSGVSVLQASVFAMGSGWVTPEEVLRHAAAEYVPEESKSSD